MPMNRKLYPDDWEAIALKIKTAANWTCQECGRPCRRPGERDGDLYLRIIDHHPGWIKDLFGDRGNLKLVRFTLTTAHVNHDPWNPDAELRAWCSACHCRYDLKAMGVKQRLKREMAGQLNLLAEAAGQGKDAAGWSCGRYYFDLDRAKAEVEAWLKARNQFEEGGEDRTP